MWRKYQDLRDIGNSGAQGDVRLDPPIVGRALGANPEERTPSRRGPTAPPMTRALLREALDCIIFPCIHESSHIASPSTPPLGFVLPSPAGHPELRGE